MIKEGRGCCGGPSLASIKSDRGGRAAAAAGVTAAIPACQEVLEWDGDYRPLERRGPEEHMLYSMIAAAGSPLHLVARADDSHDQVGK